MQEYCFNGYKIRNTGKNQIDGVSLFEATSKDGCVSLCGHSKEEVENLVLKDEYETTIGKLRYENEILHRVLYPILQCDWKSIVGRHGTEYGDDKEFDCLVELISKAQEMVSQDGRID